MFEKSLSAAAYYEEVYYQAALAALGTNDVKKTVHYLMDHLRLHPYHLEAYKLLAKLLHDNLIYAQEDELNMSERGVTLFPYETELWRTLGEIYEKQGNVENAKNIYLRGLAVDTLDADLLKRLDKLFPAQQDKPALLAQARTLQNYQEKVAKFTKMSPFYQQKLRANLEQYLKEFPGDSNAKILLARVLSLSGNDLKAEEMLRRILRVQPDDIWAGLALSSLYYKAENWSGAEQALENVLFYYPDNTLAKKRLQELNKKREK